MVSRRRSRIRMLTCREPWSLASPFAQCFTSSQTCPTWRWAPRMLRHLFSASFRCSIILNCFCSELMWKTRTNEVDLVCFEGLKTPAPPLQQPILLGAQRPPWEQYVAHCNTINLIKAIFEFPLHTWDINLQRVIFEHFEDRGNQPKMTLSPSISLVWVGNSKIATMRLLSCWGQLQTAL